MATSWSAPVDAPGRRRTPSQRCRSRCAVGYMTCSASGSRGPAAPALLSTGSATHSPIIGMCPAANSGQAASSRRARLAAMRAGSSPVPERYGPAMRIIKDGVDTLGTVTCRSRQKQGRSCMLAAQRRDLLLDRLARDGRLVAKNLAAELGVSEDSVRRDLRELAAAGLCQRVYGGALPVSPAIADHAGRERVEPASKQRVAAAAARLVAPGSTAIIDGGTTALAVVRELPLDLAATVVTHSPTVAAALVDHRDVEVFLLGGRLFKHSLVTCGAAAVEAAQAVTADLFLLGVTGVHHEAGLTTGDADEAAMKRALSRRAADTYVLASAEKIGAASRFAVLGLAAVTAVVTDADPASPAMRELARAGVSLIGVQPDPHVGVQ